MILIEGYLFGLSSVIFIGPVLFTLVQSTLEKGRPAGISTALGIIVSDIICVAVCAVGAIPFFENVTNQLWIGIAGSILLLGLGTKYTFFPSKKIKAEDTSSIEKSDYYVFFTKGFLINFVNPTVFAYWIAFLIYAESKFSNASDTWIFMSAILAGIFTIDISKVLLANKIKPLIEPKRLKLIFQIIGILLLIFGISTAWIVLNKS